MRTQREERLLQELDSMEREFQTRLVAALERCAAGQWGLFGHNDHVPGAERWNAGSGVEALLELGTSITALRERLGLGPFALYARLLALRGRADDNAPGEPKKACAWLDELRSRA